MQHIDTDAIEKANRELAIFEHLESIEKGLKGLAHVLPKNHSEELEHYIAKLHSFGLLLDESEDLPGISAQLGKFKQISKVERLGLSKEILKLRHTDGLSIAQIASRYNESLSISSISKFLSLYETYSIKEKAKIRNKESVFDTADQLESLLVTINTQLARLAYTSDAKQQENHKGYVSELRQLVKLAADFKRDLESQSKQEQFQKDVAYILINLCPQDVREKIVEILRRYQSEGFSNISLDIHISRSLPGNISSSNVPSLYSSLSTATTSTSNTTTRASKYIDDGKDEIKEVIDYDNIDREIDREFEIIDITKNVVDIEQE